MNGEVTKAELKECAELVSKLRNEAAKRVVGQAAVIDGILTALFAGGHVLLEGVSGLAKTLAVKTIADISGLAFKRIQFTPDLLPADVTGTLIYEQATGKFTVRKGPVFANVVLADEINRAPAKVQSALLEAMAEKQVTIGETTHKLPDPFFVLATQNPIEQEGTYNLPEAELDRFLLKLTVPYPTPEEEMQIVKTGIFAESIEVAKLLTPSKIAKCRAAVDAVTADDKIVQYIVSLVSITRPDSEKKPQDKAAFASGGRHSDIFHYITYGASPRAGIAMLRCAKVNALFAGRSFVLPEDVQKAAHAVMRHRLVLSYEAAADGVTADDLISKIIELMPVP